MKRSGKIACAGVLDIPAARACTGDSCWEVVHVEHPAGYCLPLANARTIFMGNPERGSIEFAKPTRWHMLHENGQRWMSDYPIEQAQHDRQLTGFRSGSVLVGGLGLGYAATVLTLRPKVKRVVVVELAAPVVSLVEAATRTNIARLGGDPSKLEIVNADLFAYLKDRQAHRLRSGARGFSGGPEFTRAFYDIWTSDGEGTFFDTVLPLKAQSLGVVKHEPVCWNEGVMRGQLGWSLTGRIQNFPDGPGQASVAEMAEMCPEDEPGAKWWN